MRKKVFCCCVILMGLMLFPSACNPKTAKVAKEAAKNIGKGASRNKAEISNSAKNVTKNTVKTQKNARPVSVTCSSCNGSGYVLTWDSYYQQ